MPFRRPLAFAVVGHDGPLPTGCGDADAEMHILAIRFADPTILAMLDQGRSTSLATDHRSES